jgi:hypothetical protein
VSDSSRNALAGKLSIGPIRIAGEGLPGQINCNLLRFEWTWPAPHAKPDHG